MGKPIAGEVVVIPFPQSNLQPGKRRPALVVADLPGDDLILCQITSRARSDAWSSTWPPRISSAGGWRWTASFGHIDFSPSSGAQSCTLRGRLKLLSSMKRKGLSGSCFRNP